MRITDKVLEAKIDKLNDMTGSPTSYATRKADGATVTNPGHFHLDHAYGGVSLHRTMNGAGGIEDVFRCGHVMKRELAGLIDAYLCALEAVRSGEVMVKL